MNPSNFLDDFVKKVVEYSRELKRENYCMRQQMLDLGNKCSDDFDIIKCDDCNTTILNYYSTSIYWFVYYETCCNCSKNFCDFRNDDKQLPNNDCDCGLPHDCATRNLYLCCCGQETYCKQCALIQINCYDNKEYLQCSYECIKDSERDLKPFVNTERNDL